jgi:hypothetical protein
MSYAGPAARTKRAGETYLIAAGTMPATRLGPSNDDGHRKRDRIMTLIGGIALGMAVGAGLALLWAPRSGADTRRAIARRGRRLRSRGRDAWTDLRDELKDAVHHRRLVRECREVGSRRGAA